MDNSTEEKAESVAVVASTRAEHVLLEAHSVVVTRDTLAETSMFLRSIKQQSRDIEAERRALVDPLNGVVKRINERFKTTFGKLEDAERVIKGKLAAYEQEQERIREEQERIQREEREKEEARLRKLAERAEGRGDFGRASAYNAMAEQTSMAPFQAADAGKVDGISYRDTYKAEVTDLKMLLGAVLAGTVPAEAVMPDMSYINQAARALKGAVTWPGVRWIKGKTVVAG